MRRERLSPQAQVMMADPANSLLFSVVSIWEVAIKASRTRRGHRLRRTLTDAGYGGLPVTGEHAERVLLLPPIHKDPFDRLLVAQAWVDGLVFLTDNAGLAAYPGSIQRV